MVDEADYEWAMQWRWVATPDKAGRKWYASRSTRLLGSRGPQTRIYLHKEILLRHAGGPPHRDYVIGDHLDGQSLNDRRSNLRWATRSMNRLNIGGAAARQLSLELGPRHRFAA